jgi:adenosylcobyric acid synthase
MTKALMVQGTMSNVGKSLITAGLCRIFAQDGYKAAPFKAQNMALNSYITDDGLEMGRAQAVQAQAAGIRPDVRMNPILLKPSSDTGSQVIVMGRVKGSMNAAEYYRRKTDYIPLIKSAYEELAAVNDIIVIEGAGSPVEINLKENDIVNMGMAEMADARVLLVGDIDRGGVFAQLLGTMELLDKDERDRVEGFIINKFRGDVNILRPGLSMIEEKCKKPVLGVVPWCDIRIEDEDSLAGDLDTACKKEVGPGPDIAVIRLKRISNFTDLAPLAADENVNLRYVDSPARLKDPDMIIIPGSKNTIEDMKLLRESGLEAAILKRVDRGTVIFGICGGYQIMGEEISDPKGSEGGGSIRGMGLLPVKTIFKTEKITRQARGRVSTLPGPFEVLSGISLSGYEIHMGTSAYSDDPAVFSLLESGEPDGCVKGSCMGTYLHGIFDDVDFREALIGLLCRRSGMSGSIRTFSYTDHKEKQFDILADLLRENLDIDRIYGLLK